MYATKPRFAAVLTVVALSLACGGAEPTVRPASAPPTPVRPAGPVSASGDSSVRAVIGRAGGTLSLRSGARLEVPAGALGQDYEVVLHEAEPARTAWDDPENEHELGPIFAVNPGMVAAQGHTFRVSVPQMALPQSFTTADLAFGSEEESNVTRALEMAGTETRWQFWPARIENGRFVAEMHSLGGHRMQFGVSR